MKFLIFLLESKDFVFQNLEPRRSNAAMLWKMKSRSLRSFWPREPLGCRQRGTLSRDVIGGGKAWVTEETEDIIFDCKMSTVYIVVQVICRWWGRTGRQKTVILMEMKCWRFYSYITVRGVLVLDIFLDVPTSTVLSRFHNGGLVCDLVLRLIWKFGRTKIICIKVMDMGRV